MNQFTMRPNLSVKREAEGLLRIVLFSKDLQLLNKNIRLATERQRLAKDLREARKRGVVPVFISTLWFLFSLAISVQSGECSNYGALVFSDTYCPTQLSACLERVIQHTISH